MTDAFEKWIMGMDDGMYEDWLDDTATDAQTDAALEIREPLSAIELAEMEREQEYIPESRVKEVDVQEVYDNRDIPPQRITADVILDPITKRIREIRQKPDTITINPQLEKIGIDLKDKSIVARTRPALGAPIGQSIQQPQTRTSFTQRISTRLSTGIRSFASRINPFRRKK